MSNPSAWSTSELRRFLRAARVSTDGLSPDELVARAEAVLTASAPAPAPAPAPAKPARDEPAKLPIHAEIRRVCAGAALPRQNDG